MSGISDTMTWKTFNHSWCCKRWWLPGKVTKVMCQPAHPHCFLLDQRHHWVSIAEVKDRSTLERRYHFSLEHQKTQMCPKKLLYLNAAQEVFLKKKLLEWRWHVCPMACPWRSEADFMGLVCFHLYVGSRMGEEGNQTQIRQAPSPTQPPQHPTPRAREQGRNLYHQTAVLFLQCPAYPLRAMQVSAG